jgi:putative transposase
VLGTSVEDVCRKLGTSQATLYFWNERHGGAVPSELRGLRQREEETASSSKSWVI